MKTNTVIKRHCEAQMQTRLYHGKALLIFGARQVGKTTMINQFLSTCDRPILRLNGDDTDVRELLEKTNTSQLRTLIGPHQIVFIAEAQRIENIGLTLKIMTDQLPEVQVIATGSSAFELSNRINEPLTGRKFEFLMGPLSFSEMVNHHGLLEEKRQLEQRLIYGYYPEIVTHPEDAKARLKLLAGSYLYKDILTHQSIQKPVLLEKILKALALQVGSEVHFAEIAQLVGADFQTIERYVDLLQKIFVIFQLPALNRNVRNEIKRGRKFYFYDNGIRNAVIGNFNAISNRTDIGSLWENYLVSERAKAQLAKTDVPGRYFWRTIQQQEIDYIEESDNQYDAFEFNWNPKKAKVTFSKTFTGNYPIRSTKVVTSTNYEEFLL